MNLVAGGVEAGTFLHAAGRVAAPGLPSGPITLGIRPEAVSIVDQEAAHLRERCSLPSSSAMSCSSVSARRRSRDRQGRRRGRPAHRGGSRPPFRPRAAPCLRRAERRATGGAAAMICHRFTTAEHPVLPAERARVFFDGIFSSRAAASGRRRGRARWVDLVRQRERRDHAHRPGRLVDRARRLDRGLHAWPRLRRRLGALCLRPPPRHGLPARPRHAHARALHRARHPHPELSGRRSCARAAPRL